MLGTLESLLVTPTSTKTMQLGSVLYDLLFIPVRTAVFLLVTGLLFGLDFDASGVVPALVVLLALLPFVWGIGVATAGLVLTFRRGTVILGFGTAVLTLLSGTLFPLNLLPHWLEVIAKINPLAIAIESIRREPARRRRAHRRDDRRREARTVLGDLARGRLLGLRGRAPPRAPSRDDRALLT